MVSEPLEAWHVAEGRDLRRRGLRRGLGGPPERLGGLPGTIGLAAGHDTLTAQAEVHGWQVRAVLGGEDQRVLDRLALGAARGAMGRVIGHRVTP